MRIRTKHIISFVLAVLFLATSNGVNLRHYCCELCAEHGSRMFTHECSCAEVHHNHADHQHASEHCCTHHHNAVTEHHGHTTCSTQENGCYLEHFDISIYTFSHIDFHFDLVTFATQISNLMPLVVSTNESTPKVSSHAPPNSGRGILTKVSVLTI